LRHSSRRQPSQPDGQVHRRCSQIQSDRRVPGPRSELMRESKHVAMRRSNPKGF
jgi:hypothetical protein